MNYLDLFFIQSKQTFLLQEFCWVGGKTYVGFTTTVIQLPTQMDSVLRLHWKLHKTKKKSFYSKIAVIL